MAHYQNGLLLTSAFATNGGRVVARWIYEFVVYVLGWTAFDSSDANFYATSGTGSAGATTANADEFDLSGDPYTVTSADQFRYITITGFTAGNAVYNGIYRILWVDAASEILHLDIKRGVHEDGLPASLTGISWRIWAPGTQPAGNAWAIFETAYTGTPTEPNLHFRVVSPATAHYPGTTAIGPFGTWNATTHAWSDSRNTADKSMDSTETHYGAYVWACGDDTTFTFGYKCSSYNQTELHFCHVGEFTPLAATDTNPGVLIWGSSYNFVPAMGPGSPSLNNDVRFMAYNGGGNDVAIAGFIAGPCVPANGTEHLFLRNRNWSQWSRRMYRTDVLLISQTASHREVRGTLKNVWFTGPRNTWVTPFGASLEYLHLGAGMVIPWNGSKTHVQWDNDVDY